MNSSFFILTSNNYNWINIDKLVLIDNKIDVSFSNKKTKITGFNIYLTYEKLDAFLIFHKKSSDLNFEKTPICGKTHLTFIGGNDENREIYYDKIELKEAMNDSKLQLNMKKTTKEALKKLFD